MSEEKTIRYYDPNADEELRAENLAARPYYCDDGIRRLMTSVCLAAVEDYLKPSVVKTHRLEIERFFDSPMFCYITGMSGKEEAIRRIRSVPRAYQSTLIKSLAKAK